jgi:hypothetical protein
MTESTGPPESSTNNAKSAAMTEVRSLLGLRGTDRKCDGRPAASQLPRRARKIRFAAASVTILVLASIGWGAAQKAPARLELASVSSWLQDSADAVLSKLDEYRKLIVSSTESVASRSAAKETTITYVEARSVGEALATVARGLFVRMDQLHAASARELTEIAGGVDRSSRLIERSQRELMSRLDEMQERLARLESHAAGSSNMEQSKRVENPSAERAAPAAPRVLPQQTPGGAPSAPARVKRIESWAVREVVDGLAILAGPQGLIGVSSGDVVPGVGRIESIMRRRGRWIVATSSGVITSP